MSADKIEVYIGHGGRDTVLEAALGDVVTRIERVDHGKPYVPGGVEFNLSHSGDVTVCAVSELPVGVDIELMKEREISRLIKAFDERERCLIEEAGDGGLREFYRAWTVKEAVCKLYGCGISKKRLQEINYVAPECFAKSFIYAGEYILTVCAECEKEIVFRVEEDVKISEY